MKQGLIQQHDGVSGLLVARSVCLQQPLLPAANTTSHLCLLVPVLVGGLKWEESLKSNCESNIEQQT